MTVDPNLAVTEEDLKRLADDLDAMRTHIDGQVRRMDAIVDRAEARWRSEAATAYRKLHRDAGADAVRVREILGVLAEAVRMSRDGFTRQELDILRQFRAEMKKVDIDAEVRELSGEGPGGAGPGGGAVPTSRLNDM
ncbi:MULTISPECIES: WXG100 family type VII secretion target [unclassified Streptomyces]|uniref:WXG100 family type VII secretion target n=1 Tax=unclassified Streptomyces TaxID=2593676 RepID=UPI002DDB0E6D|nr:WXG100 family type VII secretion target [Streptomyces sp. NBC_01237]WRZ78350.1 WXG100 family type VII secretion target [Streptomyces sp. NBC_01237]